MSTHKTLEQIKARHLQLVTSVETIEKYQRENNKEQDYHSGWALGFRKGQVSAFEEAYGDILDTKVDLNLKNNT